MTKHTMLKRWNRHAYDALKQRYPFNHFHNAIRKYGKDAFSHEILEVCFDLDVANLAEECWIEFYDTRNPEKGFNLKRGGDHTPHPIQNPWDRPEFREKALASLTKANARTPEERAKTSRTLWQDPGFREKTIAANKAAHNTPEYLAKISAVQRGKTLSPSHAAKLIAGVKAKWRDPEFRARMSTAISEGRKGIVFTPEHLANISEAQRGRRLSAETRAKIGAKAREAAARRRAKAS